MQSLHLDFEIMTKQLQRVNRAVHSIIEENTNISMGQIIWNRTINKKLNYK